MKAFASRIACGSFVSSPIFLGVLLKRQANWFVFAAAGALVAVFTPNSTGAVEADLLEMKPGAVTPGVAALFFCAHGRGPAGQKNHTPARTSRPSKINTKGR